ncbi:MAG: hypothetical protein V2J24_01080 [Pseudomonadales bacterium]|jgi:hypothetical protein|nr:hypothetical protein [Pseudomonadales bacterium]
MKRLTALAAIALLALTGLQARAEGTAANTPVTNQAFASYNVGGTSVTEDSNVVTFNVDEIIEVVVNAVGAATDAAPNETDAVLAFDVRNDGNGPEDFDLLIDAVRTGDQFDPTVDTALDIYLDDGDLIFEPGVGAGNDTVFNPATDVLTLLADETRRIWIRGDIPGLRSDGTTALQSGDLGTVNVQADTTTGALAGAAPGTAAEDGGEGGVDAVVGTSQGTANDDQSYVVSTVDVSLVKSVVNVDDGFGADDADDAFVPGAIVTYEIAVTVDGSGTAASLIITDTIDPAVTSNVAYVQGSVLLDGSGQTDAADGVDATQVNFLVPGDVGAAGDVAGGGVTIQVDLGDVTPVDATTPTQFSIRFDVEIQ